MSSGNRARSIAIVAGGAVLAAIIVIVGLAARPALIATTGARTAITPSATQIDTATAAVRVAASAKPSDSGDAAPTHKPPPATERIAVPVRHLATDTLRLAFALHMSTDGESNVSVARANLTVWQPRIVGAWNSVVSLRHTIKPAYVAMMQQAWREFQRGQAAARRFLTTHRSVDATRASTLFAASGQRFRSILRLLVGSAAYLDGEITDD